MTKERGRPRAFNAEAALDQALQVFWRHGYQGASLAELTAAMGLSKPSLYAAFGDKEALYLKSLEHYLATHLQAQAAILDAEPEGRKAVRGFLRGMATLLANPELPGGCFIFTGIADCEGTGTPTAVAVALKASIHQGESKLKARLRRAQKEGHLGASHEVNALATYFTTLLAGLAIQAKAGAPKAKLWAAVDVGMGVWAEP